jgi:hypothetical protein
MSATTEIQDFNKRVRLTKSGTQSLPNATETTATWNTETIDTDSMHEGVTNPARITINTAGDYVIGTNIVVTSAGKCTVKILLNVGATVLAEQTQFGGAVKYGNYLKTVRRLAQGDYIYVTVNPAALTTLEAVSSFFAYRIG